MNLSNLRPARDFAIQFGGIYAIANKINGKIYIGSAINVKSRLRRHKINLTRNKHPNKHLQSAWNLCAIDFEFYVLEIIWDDAKLLEREQYWINKTECYKKEFGYNARHLANSNLGLKFSEETKKKMSLSGKGHKRNKGMKWSEEAKAKLSKIMKGRKHTPKHIEKRIAYKRKPDKWPHGYICKCKSCMKLKSLAIIAKRKSKLIELTK